MTDGIRDRWQADLREAIRARDRVRIVALRGVLAAVGNAEAVPAASEAGAALLGIVGVGATEAERRVVTDADALDICRTEIADRERAAAVVEARDPERAARLRGEAAALRTYVS